MDETHFAEKHNYTADIDRRGFLGIRALTSIFSQSDAQSESPASAENTLPQVANAVFRLIARKGCVNPDTDINRRDFAVGMAKGSAVIAAQMGIIAVAARVGIDAILPSTTAEAQEATPELEPAGALTQAYAVETRFGGQDVYRIAFDSRDIFEPVLTDSRVTDLMDVPLSNEDWVSLPRDVLYVEEGQERVAPLRHWGYIRHGRNITVITPTVFSGVVRRPDAGRGGSGDRVLVFKIPTENGTIAVAKPLDHQRFIQPGTRTGVDDFIFTPDAAVMEQLLNTTPETAIDFMELYRAGYFRSNRATDGILGGEDEVDFWNQQVQDGRVQLVSYHYRGREPRRIFDNLPPEHPDTENHGSFDISGYIRVEQG